MKKIKLIATYMYNYAIYILLFLIALCSIVLYALKKEDIQLPGAKPLYHFYFIGQNSADPFWKEVMRGVEESAEDNNVVVEIYAPRFNDPTEELKYIDIATISKVDGIITHVTNSEGFTDLINKAVSKDIPVITFENDDAKSNRNAYIGTNSFMVGKEAARLLAEATGGKARIAIISSDDGSQGSIEHNAKMYGFSTTLKNYPDMKVVKSYSSKMGVLSAEEITQNIIESDEEINAIFTLTSADTLGSVQFIVNSNKVGQIAVVGYGNSEEILRYIDKEIIYGTIASDPYNMGYESIKSLIAIKSGEIVPEFIDTDIQVITKKNLDEFIIGE
ncbi:D-allose-binding periplasmic protein precursor [Clostridium sp. N3C]|uniref:substrate-binding domain-containing protein n=1 Tax=Clostridium sp. N3C TaxID=1776758 RepID=UPI00092E01A3|nr:substrate-binding domain-containing protein [Clostridium sp. N3C]SCN22677.1 D-allose-binding periplasmic protein precursor [Clostridium sp. N3C]